MSFHHLDYYNAWSQGVWDWEENEMMDSGTVI
jgi:hypothetical protein